MTSHGNLFLNNFYKFHSISRDFRYKYTTHNGTPLVANTNEQRSRSDLCEGVIRREATETEGLVLLKLDCCLFVCLFVCLSGLY